MSSGTMGTPPRKPCAVLALSLVSSSRMARRLRKSRDGGLGGLGAEASSFPRRPWMFPLGIGGTPPRVGEQPRAIVGEPIRALPYLALRTPPEVLVHVVAGGPVHVRGAGVQAPAAATHTPPETVWSATSHLSPAPSTATLSFACPESPESVV